MNTNYKKIICEICGKEAWVTTRRQNNYCDNPECQLEMYRRRQRKSSQKYVQNFKKMKELVEGKEAKAEEVEEVKEAKAIRRAKVEEVEEKVESPVLHNDLIEEEKVNLDDIVELARVLGEIRHRLILAVEQEFANLDKCNKEDITTLHRVEFGTLDENKMKLAAENRNKRRIIKQRISIIKLLLDNILIKRPKAVVLEYLKLIETEPNTKEVVEKIASDEHFMVKKKN